MPVDNVCASSYRRTTVLPRSVLDVSSNPKLAILLLVGTPRFVVVSKYAPVASVTVPSLTRFCNAKYFAALTDKSAPEPIVNSPKIVRLSSSVVFAPFTVQLNGALVTGNSMLDVATLYDDKSCTNAPTEV